MTLANNKKRYNPKQEAHRAERAKDWADRVENFETTHQVGFESYYRKTLYAVLVTGNGSQWSAVTVLGKRELLALQKEVNKMVDLYCSDKPKVKSKRVLKRRKK